MADDASAGEGTASDRRDAAHMGYEIFIGVLSVLSIVNLVLKAAIADEELSMVLLTINLLLSIIFLADFLYRLTTAPSRKAYLLHEFGWADLLASLPFQQVKVLRVFRLLRIYRLLRRFGPREIIRNLRANLAGSALLTLLLLGILVLEFGSVGILYIEQDAEGANITTASDALWYVLVTISTVGYGDQFPVTNRGRVLGSLIIVIGVGIFGTFTGYLANLFLSPRQGAEDAAGADEAH